MQKNYPHNYLQIQKTTLKTISKCKKLPQDAKTTLKSQTQNTKNTFKTTLRIQKNTLKTFPTPLENYHKMQILPLKVPLKLTLKSKTIL